MNITIKDIAAEAGVSITTVSLILNNKNCRVSERTRKLVMDIASKYNYTPNLSARALVMKQSNTIGLIIPDISNPFFAELAKGVENEAQKNGYSVIFCDSSSNGKKDVANFKLLANRQIDGLIIVTSINENDFAYANEFNYLAASSGVPVVLFDRKILGGNYDMVSIDHHEGGYMATKFLIDLQYKKIGCITGPLDVESAKERFEGYIDALKAHGVDVDDSIIRSGDYSLETGHKYSQELLSNGAEAIFACNDMIACGAIRVLKNSGKHLGVDFAIIGFDNSPICEFLDVPLTTVNQPVYDMGKTACSMLIKNMYTKTASAKQLVKFSPNIIIRETANKHIPYVAVSGKVQ